MKLTGQAGQYWENFERIMRYMREDPIETRWHERETKAEICSTVVQTTSTGWVEYANSRKEVGHDYIVKFKEGAVLSSLSLLNRPYQDIGQVLKMITIESS